MAAQHPTPFTRSWRARWIWHRHPSITLETATLPVLADPTDTVVLLRRRLHLADVPSSVPCRIWGDGRYLLKVNGTEVGHGPVRSDPRRPHYDTAELAPLLTTGENVIAITARHFGRATSWWVPAPTTYTLGAGSVVFEALIGDEWVVSDASWTSHAGDAWTAIPLRGDVASLPIESFDARVFPYGWDLPGFDDRGWSQAAEILPFHTGAHGDPHPPNDPFGVIGPPVRYEFCDGATHEAVLTSTEVIASTPRVSDPVDQVLADERQRAGGSTAGEDVVRYTFDLGRIAAGTVEMVVRGAAEGAIVDVAAAEHIDAGGNLAGLGQHSGFRYVCRGDEIEEFATLDTIGTRYLHAMIRSSNAAPAPNLEFVIRDRHRPRPSSASFACSDPWLERIHATGLRTVDLCASDAYVDCPTREQRAWTGDSVVHQMVDLVANPDWSLARWHPEMAAVARPDGMLVMAAACDFAIEDRMFVPDWSLHWVRSVHNLYRYTGDRDLVARLLPVAERTLRWFEAYLDPNGLLSDVTGWVLIDWASVYSSGTSSTLNALWARALEDLAEMADWLGNGFTATWARERRDGVAASFDVFWDETRGVYVDHMVAGEQGPTAAQHPGAAALAAGIVPESRLDTVVAGITDRARLIRHSWVMDPVTVGGGSTGFMYLTTGYPEPDWDVDHQMVEAEPFFRYVVHDGLARAGRAELVADACRDWRVFLDAGETTWPECWTGGTRCHGWSSTPTRDLIVHTLGITPAEPGYASVRVVPALGDLEWARASVPTPHGLVTVEAHADGTLSVDSPVPVVRE
jgi:hypothetical protein